MVVYCDCSCIGNSKRFLLSLQLLEISLRNEVSTDSTDILGGDEIEDGGGVGGTFESSAQENKFGMALTEETTSVNAPNLAPKTSFPLEGLFKEPFFMTDNSLDLKLNNFFKIILNIKLHRYT